MNDQCKPAFLKIMYLKVEQQVTIKSAQCKRPFSNMELEKHEINNMVE